MSRMLRRVILLIAVLNAFPAYAGDQPVPRFVSLRSDEVNVRAGPGTRYPIQWIYKREGLPVEVVEEFDQWRKIRDMEGANGWVHKTMLDGHRYVLIAGKKPQLAYDGPSEESGAVMKLAPKVQARLLECKQTWCRIYLKSHKGWIRKEFIWGVYPDEQFD